MLLKGGEYSITYFDNILIEIKKLCEPEKNMINEIITICKVLLLNSATISVGRRMRDPFLPLEE